MVRGLCVRDLVTEKFPVKHLCTSKHDHPRNKLQQECLTISQESTIGQSSSPSIMSYTTITRTLDWQQERSSERLPRRRIRRRGHATRAHSCVVHNPRTEAFQRGYQSNSKGDNHRSQITVGKLILTMHDAHHVHYNLTYNLAQWMKTKNLAQVVPRRRWHAHRADCTDYNPRNDIIEQECLSITQKKTINCQWLQLQDTSMQFNHCNPKLF